LNPEGKFSHTPYNFPTLVKVCEQLAHQAVKKTGGRIEKNKKGQEVFVIPVRTAKPSKLEECWEAGPVANSKFSKQEMTQVKVGNN
jgi:hypothetical protein